VALENVPRFEAVASLLVGGAVAILVQPSFGAVIWAIGAIFTLAETRRETRLDERFQKIDRLGEAFDLGQSSKLPQLQSLISNYLAIPEVELARVKDAVVAAASDDLFRLATEKSSGELPSGEYYSWLLPMLDDTKEGATVRALSMMMECEWDDSEPERRFIKANIDAAERGVRVQRIFVSAPEVILDAIERMPAMKPQLAWEDPPSLVGYFVDRSFLERSDPQLLRKLRDGFIDLDGRVALIDLHSMDGSARGEVTMHPAKLGSLQDIYSQLLLQGRVLDKAFVAELRAGHPEGP
jgi:hypothetical protein